MCSGLLVPDANEQAQGASLRVLYQHSCFNKYKGQSTPHCYPDLLVNLGSPHADKAIINKVEPRPPHVSFVHSCNLFLEAKRFGVWLGVVFC